MACLYRLPLVVNGTQGGRLSRAPETMKTAPESGSTPIKLSVIFQVKFNSYSYLEINVRSISVRVFEHLADSCDINDVFQRFFILAQICGICIKQSTYWRSFRQFPWVTA